MSAGRSEKRKYPDNGWGGGFGAYMKKKAAKLAKQFDNGASESAGSDSNGKFSKIFKGISIYVNGFTDPPASKLKKLMMMHGGRYIYYPNKSNTTHIVANNLAYTKVKELKNEKVVSPKWITDSVEAGKLLPHAPYLIYRPKASNQSLHRFAYKKRSEREAEKESSAGGSVSSSEGPVTEKPGPVQLQKKSANMSGPIQDSSKDVVSESSSRKMVSINVMGKSKPCIVNSCDAANEKYKEKRANSEMKTKLLVLNEQKKSEQSTAYNGNSPVKKLLTKKEQQIRAVNLPKLESANKSLVEENLFEKFRIQKRKSDSNFEDKIGQGSRRGQQYKGAGSSSSVKNSSVKSPDTKYRKEVDSDGINKEKRNSCGISQSKMGCIGQTSNFSEKNPVQKSTSSAKSENVKNGARGTQGKQPDGYGQKMSSSKTSPLKKNGSDPSRCNTPSGKGFHVQMCSSVDGSKSGEHKHATKESSTSQIGQRSSSMLYQVAGSSDTVKNSVVKSPDAKYRKEVDIVGVKEEKRKSCGISQSKMGCIGQTSNFPEKNPDQKSTSSAKSENVKIGVRESQGKQPNGHGQKMSSSKTSPLKKNGSDPSRCNTPPGKGLQMQNCLSVDGSKSGEHKHATKEFSASQIQQRSSSMLYQVAGSSDSVKNSVVKSPDAKYRKEVDISAVKTVEKRKSDVTQSKTAVIIGQTKNFAAKRPVQKSTSSIKSDYVKDSGRGSQVLKQPDVQGQKTSSPKSSPLKKIDSESPKSKEPFAKGLQMQKCWNGESSKSEEHVVKESSTSKNERGNSLVPYKVARKSDTVKNSVVKSPDAKYRKEVDTKAVIKLEKRICSDAEMSEMGDISQIQNSSEKSPVQKSTSNGESNYVSNDDGKESQIIQPNVDGQKMSSPKSSLLQKVDSDSQKSTELFGKGLQMQNCHGLNIDNSMSEECDEKEGSASHDNETAPSTQLNNCYFPKSNDPNFLPTFYRHSSFYHLTTWRAEHKVFVKKLHEKGDRSFPGKKKLIAMFQKNCPPDQNKNDNSDAAKLEKSCGNEAEQGVFSCGSQDETENGKPRMIMHIDMDAFFVAVSLLNYPELLGKPVAVAHYAAKPKKAEKVLPRKEGQFESKSQVDGVNKTVKDESFKESQDEQQLSKQFQGSSNSTAPLHPGLGMAASESDNFTSLAAIASCSYEAREKGIRNGMLMRDAKELCPELRTIPYDFEGYHRISRLLYETVASYTHDITASSCDEVVVDITNLMKETGATALQIADTIRKEVWEKTKCTASAGLASNVILAKLCTKAAKPNGMFLVKDDDVADFLKKAPVGDLPGIGRAFNKKMQSLGVFTCEDLQKVPIKVLQKEFGPRTGVILYQNCRGCDTHHLTADRQRKYVSVEVNYGIRFDGDDDAYQFINLLCREIHCKMKKLGMVGRRISLKLKIRRPGTPIEDPKYMGYGVSDDKIRSLSLSQETNDAGTIERTCKSLYLHTGVDAKDIRGVGIQLTLLKKLSKGQAVSKSLTEMLPKKEDVPKSPKLIAPPDEKPKSKTYSMLDFMEKKSGSRANSSITPESFITRKWSGLPPVPFALFPSDCLIPFAKINPSSLKTAESDCLLSGKQETAMDLWSKSVPPSRPSSVRRLSFGNAARNKDIKVQSPNLSLPSTNEKTDPENREKTDAAPTLMGTSPLSGCTATPTKIQKSGKLETWCHQPFNQTSTSPSPECTPTSSKTQNSEIKFDKASSNQPSNPTAMSSFTGLAKTPTVIRKSDEELSKPCSDQTFTLTATSSLKTSTSTPNKTQQSDTKVEKVGTDQSSSPTDVGSLSSGCTPTLTETVKSDTKLDKSDSDQPDIPTTTLISSGCTPTPSTNQKSDTKFQLPPPTELDLSVLQSLPSEICDQIIQEYRSSETQDAVAIERIKSFDPNKASTSTGITSELDQDVLQNLPPEILQEVLAEERRKITRKISEESSQLSNEPSSYSEIDKSCLEALPKDLQNEVCEKYKPKSQLVIGPDVKVEKGEMSLSPEDKEPFSQRNQEVKTTCEKLPWRRDIREVLSMQGASPKNETLTNGSEMGSDGERGGEDGDEENDSMGGTSQSKQEANGWPKEAVASLDGAVKLWEVKAKLAEWIDTFEDPLDEDISHVVHYLRTLILEQNLEMVFQVLRALKRIVTRNGQDCWKEACDTITKRIQTTIHQMYGSTLKLD